MDDKNVMDPVIKKRLSITEDENCDIRLEVIGFTQFEMLGVLRLFEQRVSIDILHNSVNKIK